MKVFLCEKPSQGRDIAKVLGCNQKLDGALQGNGAIVTWGVGHLFAQADPEHYDEAYQTWSLDSLPIVPAPWKSVVPADKKKQLAAVKRCLAKATEVVIATDPDREGEVIARDILEHHNYTGPISRLWLSSLDEASIKKGLATLKPSHETKPLHQSGRARSRADWLIGMNFTRLCSVIGREAGYTNVLSVGRVQTPTLRIVVERDEAIAHFVPVPFYDVVVDAGFRAKWQVPESLADEANRCLSSAAAQNVVNQCQGQTAQVTDFETKRRKVSHPKLFHLGSLQKEMSAKHGHTAQQVLDAAQALYEKHKLTTYPRTDCDYLPLSQLAEAPLVLQALGDLDAYHSHCQQANPQIKSGCWNDKKVEQSAHHAIIPTFKKPSLEGLSEREKHVYQAIVERYLAQFFESAEDDITTINIRCGEHAFKASGKIERVAGWRVVLGKEAEAQDEEGTQTLPALSNGESVTISSAKVLNKKTSPPSAFSEGTLLDAMANIARSDTIPAQFKNILKETAGLGTQATRAGVLETLKKRGYVVNKGKKLISTDTGRALIHALPNELSSPAMTAIWEQALESIEQGAMPFDDFMANQEGFVRALVSKVKNGEVTLELPKVIQPIEPCPLCKGNMKLIQGKRSIWVCQAKDKCGLILDSVRSKPAKNAPCSCKQGVQVLDCSSP